MSSKFLLTRKFTPLRWQVIYYHCFPTTTTNIGIQFKFYYPDLNYSPKLKGLDHEAFYNHFLVECRTNGSLIKQGKNGTHTPFCYGWIEVPCIIETYVARKYNVQPFCWDRPPGAEQERIQGILYEYLDGKTLANVHLTPQIADDTRTALTGLHNATVAHGDIRPSHILVEAGRVRLLDLSTSKSMPHIRLSKDDLKNIQKMEQLELEVGFSLLSEVRISNASLGE